MTPKEKAKELVDKFSNVDIMFEGLEFILCEDELSESPKQCALIAVGEILDIEFIKNASFEFYDVRSYWREVKNEINKL